MEKRIKKLMISTAVSLVFMLATWLVVCLAVNVKSGLGTALSIATFIPCGYFVVCGIKLSNALGFDKLFRKLYSNV